MTTTPYLATPRIPQWLLDARARVLRVYLPTTDDWGGSFALERASDRECLITRDPKMLCKVKMHAVLDYDRSIKGWHIKGWYITVRGTDDTEMTKRFDTEEKAREGFLYICGQKSITMAMLDEQRYHD